MLSRGEFDSIVFSQSGKQLLTASSFKPNIAQIWDLETGQEIRRFEGHLAGLHTANYNYDETQIVTGAGTNIFLNHIPADYTARIWNAMTGKQVKELSGHKGFIYSAVFSKDSTRILTTGDDSTAILWDTKTAKEIFRFPKINFQRVALFSPNGSLVLAIRGGDGHYYAQFWDSTTGKELRRCEGHKKSLTDVRFNRDGKLLLTASEDTTVRIWDVATAREVRVLAGHKDSVISARFCTNDKQIVTASRDGMAKIWDASTGAHITSFPHPAPLELAESNLDGTRLLTRYDEGKGVSQPVAVLWNVTTGKQLTRIPLPGIYGRNHAIFSPDGKSFFITLHRYAMLCSAETGEPIRDYR